MKRVLISLVLVILGVPGLVSAEIAPQVYFFYGDGCPHCALVEPVIDQLAVKYPDVRMEKMEVYKNRDNALKLNDMFESHDVTADNRGVPVVFLNGTYFLGDKPIIENLEKEIVNFKKEITAFTTVESATDPLLTKDQSVQEVPAKPAPPSLWVITSMALVDSINPCAIAVLIILLGALLAYKDGDKKRLLAGGLAFTAAIYIAYFLFGLGISFSFQLFEGSSYWIFKGMGVLAIILGLANIKDFVWYGGGGFVMEIPRSWRPLLQKIIKGVVSPLGAFLTGFVVTLFELPCTGGPYFVVLGLLSVNESIYQIIPTLLYYNLFFVLPLLLITFLIYLGYSSVEKAGQWKDRNIRVLHLVAGVIMALLGVWVLMS